MPTPSALSTGYAAMLEQKFIENDQRATGDASKVRAARFGLAYPLRFSVQAGQRFDRIVQVRENDTHPQPGVHAFVERSTGLLIKPAGYKAPQKSKTTETGWASRYDLSTREGFEEALNDATWTGSYLYAR
jgi:hypothetical protein